MCRVLPVTTEQLSLLQGDALSQHRFTLCAILEDALRVAQTALVDGRPASRHDVDLALTLIGKIADELRAVGPEEDVPF